MSKTTYTVREVARVLGVAPATVYKLCKARELDSTRIGGLFRITAVALRKKLKLGQKDEIIIPPEPADSAPGEV